MSHITGTDRSQSNMFPPTMDEMVAQDNTVRVIDLFVDRFDLKKLSFMHSVASEEGRPPYLPADMMKLYLYGYLNRIRSSRKLEKECERNIELIWLMKGLRPRYHTIDGSKFRAQNASKNNFNEKKIERQLLYIDEKINQYMNELTELDKQENGDRQMDVEKIKSRIKTQEQRRKKYESLREELKQSGEEQISTTDKDARSMIINHGRIEVAYNTQTATDAKNCLIVHYETTNTNDRKALFNAATQTKNNLQKESIEVLADKGYHNGEQLHTCRENNIITYVAVPEVPRPKMVNVPTSDYFGEKFIYNEPDDSFTCPEGKIMKTNGNWYSKHYDTPVKHYKTPACSDCKVKTLCTANPRGRLMERSKYAGAAEQNKKRTETEKEKYLLRQQIVEHPFGIIKRQWGYDHVLMKGKQKNEAEFGLIFSAFNLRRIISILGINGLKKRLRGTFFNFYILYHAISVHVRKYFSPDYHALYSQIAKKSYICGSYCTD